MKKSVKFSPVVRERSVRMVLAQFKPARVNIDYHVALEGHNYSVPHQHVGAAVELRVTATTLNRAGNLGGSLV
jgi:hypothetical protein